MGKVKNNVVTKGFSGKFGEDIIFRQVDNNTFFAKRTSATLTPSAKQSEVRNKFTEASLYASAAVDNPQASLEYKLMAELQGLKSAYLAAITDFLTHPEIASVFTRAYKGHVGDILSIKPKVRHKIIEIEVSIFDANGALIESGRAITHELTWRYTATVENANVSGSKLLLVARDRTGKESTFEQVL